VGAGPAGTFAEGPGRDPHRALRWSGAAAGPAPWIQFAVLIVAWTVAAWIATEFVSPAASAVVIVLGLLAFWLLVPKSSEKQTIPYWMIVPLAAAFIAGIFLASLAASLDDELLPIGYGLWFVLWLQFGLWLRARLGPRPHAD
jgi:hypothetical protein